MVDFFCFLSQFEIHEVAHGEESYHPALVRDRQMSAIVRLHGFHGIFQAGRFVNGGHLGTHDVANWCSFWIAAFYYDPLHEVAFAENAAQFAAVEDRMAPTWRSAIFRATSATD